MTIDGFFDFIGGKDFSKMTDLDVGLNALKKFHDRASFYHGKNFSGVSPYTYDQMIEVLRSLRGGESQIRGLGLGIKLIEMSESGVKSAMKSLADATKGKLPRNTSVFRQALSEEAQNIDIGRFFDEVVVETVIDVAVGLETTGKAVLEVGKGAAFWASYSKFILPVVGVGALYFVGSKFKLLEKLNGKGFGGLKKLLKK